MVVKPNPPGNCGKPMVSCLPLDIQKVALVHDYLVKLGPGRPVQSGGGGGGGGMRRTCPAPDKV